jgi:mono/diheme cytochrome c family protein
MRESRTPNFALLWCGAAAVAAGLFLVASVYGGELVPPADPAASNYMLKCAGCHTVGGGKLTGPDLKDSALWSEKDLLPKIKLMEKHVGPLSLEETHSFAQFLKDPQVRERIQAEQARIAKADEAKYEKGDARKGADLFYGRAVLRMGGLSCVACHGAGTWGGGLGLDLHQVFPRMGETALISAIEKGQFKVMDAAYRKRPISRQEAIHLTKFLEEASKAKRAQDQGPLMVMAWAWGLCLLSLAGVAFYYRRKPGGRKG